MDDFRTLLVESEQSKKERALMDAAGLLDHGYGYRQFARLQVGAFFASIQASRHHYCKPRETHADPSVYTEWEVAIFEAEGDWVCGDALVALDAPEWVRSLFAGDQVAGYVPTETVQRLLGWLEHVSAS